MKSILKVIPPLFGLFFPKLVLAAGASLAIATINQQAGLEFNLNYSQEVYNNTFLKLDYLELFVYSGKLDDRYRKETTSAGQEICRDTTNGQFSDKENCRPPYKVEYQPSVGAYYTLNDKFDFGLGFKLRPLWGSSPMFATLAIHTTDTGRAFFRFGGEYASLGYEIQF